MAAQIRAAAADVPLVEMGSPRLRLVVLVLVLGLFGGGLAAGLPTSEAQAMRDPDCGPGWVVRRRRQRHRRREPRLLIGRPATVSGSD